MQTVKGHSSCCRTESDCIRNWIKSLFKSPYASNNLFEKNVVCKSYSNNNVEIYLHANGYVSPCCWLGDLTIHESKNIIQNYSEVNIKNKTLEEILEGEYFQSLWNGIQNKSGAYRLQTCLQTCGIN